jgi:hypothetical protein
MTKDNRTYFHKRALQEDEAVRNAKNEAARDCHLELAAAYRMLCTANSNSQGGDTGQDL